MRTRKYHRSAVEGMRIYDGATLLLGNAAIPEDTFDVTASLAVGGDEIMRVELAGDFFAIQNLVFGGIAYFRCANAI